MNESMESKVYTKLCDIAQYEKSILERLDDWQRIAINNYRVLECINKNLIRGIDDGK